MSESRENYEYLMNISTGLYLICYIPELYANYKNKNANFWNVPEKVILFAGTCLSLAYGAMIQDSALIFNYAPLFCLDTIALGMRSYYAYKNRLALLHNRLHDLDASKSSAEDSNRRDGPIRETASTHAPEV